MRWTDVLDIAIALEEKHPDMDVTYIRFTDLMAKVMALDGFEDVPERCNEKILEAIQAAWLDERE
jgi:FeS assembly protein IscX